MKSRNPTASLSAGRLALPAMTLALLATLVTASLALGATGKGVNSWLIPGASNVGKECVDLDGTYADAGTTWSQLKLEQETLTNGPHTSGPLTVTISNLTNTSFDWSSNIGIDAVVVKDGEAGANFYVYDGLTSPADGTTGTTGGIVRNVEETSDTNLTVPGTQGISHISFCYDIELVVTKTATPTFTRTFQWTIDKSVTPATWNMFTGDSGTSEYTVTVTKTGFTDSAWAVSGTISIVNPHPSASATVTGVTDIITGGINATVNCGVTFPHSLAAGGTLNCTYSSALPDGTNRVNTATATTDGTNGIGGGSGTANIVFGDPTTVVNGTVNVTDSVEGSLGSFSNTGSVSYSRTFDCDADEGTHNNTATIVETGQFDSASVTVNCYALTVTKGATTSLTRTWTWTIDKVADEDELLLAPGQLYTVNYQVTVDATSADSGWAVAGAIAVTNPAPIAATINSVTDVVSPAIAASVNCGVTFPYTLAAGATLNCTYSAALPDAADRTNTATATLQNYDYDKNGVGTASGTTNFSGVANVSFANATVTEVDECVDVFDTNAVTLANPTGFLGEVCAADAPETFNYSLDFGQHPDADVQLECGDNRHTNTASFVTNDTGTTDDDSWIVDAHVACQFGCTLTPGYWKTHSIFGPAPYDDTWALLPMGENTTFFLSGQTYYQVLWTSPSGGNAYYILAHAYIAAELNFLNGADPSEIQAAFDQATALFEAYTPDAVAGMKGKNGNAVRALFISLAETLDDWNNGITGPGHCDEDGNSAVAGISLPPLAPIRRRRIA